MSDHDPVVIPRRNGENLVMMSYEDYSATEETAYLLKSPKNAKRLRERIKSFEERKGKEHELIEDE